MHSSLKVIRYSFRNTYFIGAGPHMAGEITEEGISLLSLLRKECLQCFEIDLTSYLKRFYSPNTSRRTNFNTEKGLCLT